MKQNGMLLKSLHTTYKIEIICYYNSYSAAHNRLLNILFLNFIKGNISKDNRRLYKGNIWHVQSHH